MGVTLVQVAIYFAFLGMYTRWLLFPAALGIFLHFTDQGLDSKPSEEIPHNNYTLVVTTLATLLVIGFFF